MRYDPLLTRALAAELRAERAGDRTRELRLDRERRAARLAFRSGPDLVFLLHPRAGHILQTSDVAGDAASPYPLRGHRLVDVRAPTDERLLVLELAPPVGGAPDHIVVELMTNQWNLLLLEAREDAPPPGRIRAALWPREAGERVLRAGADYRPPPGERAWSERPPSPAEWSGFFEPVPPDERRSHALRKAAFFSAIDADYILGEAAGRAGPEPLARARERYVALREAEPRPCVLAPGDGDAVAPQPYPHDLEDESAMPADSLLGAMRIAARRAGILAGPRDEESDADTEAATAADERTEPHEPAPAGDRSGGEPDPEPAPPDPERERLREALEERRDYLERRIGSLRRELERGEDPEDLREIGNLLLARMAEIPRGRESVVLEDFAGEERAIELDPKLAPAENAESYYERAARRERAAERVPREIGKAKRRRDEVSRALRELPETGVTDELWRLAGGRPGTEKDAGGEEKKLPYRRFFSSGGHEIRVGRGAKQNEELTFHHSSPEDVWLHARQVPGAHVVLRWGHRQGNPPRRDLLEAAVLAALHSEARHSGTVGVDWTRRKYVRSPRKSPPGVVVPDRTKTVFVEPDEDVARRLRRP